ncbi:cysteine-rich receptor-like protein kinase 2 [Aristolochia californica]|uniref:cysteine-rich receptor-like protein kinase 2 n=1 Tax=Aristolochia californica TaxID=171875 RepID=UPI0035DFB790
MGIRFIDPDFFFFSFFAFSAVSIVLFAGGVSSDPQIKLLNKGCSQYNVTNPSEFFSNLNATFSDIRGDVVSSSHFAVVDRARATDPLYVLFQCRNYLSSADCLSCFSAAAAQIRNCSAANGARVIYDGCFLRYESNVFYDQTTLPGNGILCGNETAQETGSFNASAQGLLQDLVAATPRINRYFAAVRRDSLYAVAQCVEMVTQSGCGDCLKVAYSNMQRCLPEKQGMAFDAGCFLRYSSTAFFGANQTIDLAPFLRKGGSSKKNAIIGGVAGGAGFLLLLVFLFYLLKRLTRVEKTRNDRDILGATELRGPVNFHYKDLKSATNNFSEENKLGEGGFGGVYMGLLKNGNKVAVKKLAITQDHRVQANFKSEVKLISNVHHRNLVRLLGCCSKGPELLLVYEFMANKSLDKFLFGDRSGSLNWKQRFDIIVGIARGLAYLHDEFHVCIIHRDIKSSNILLDDDLQAKIADFGLARLLPENQSHLSTKFAGTLGYTAPEYAIHGQLSEKVDTYSFGVVVLEIIGGRKSNDIKLEPVTQYLLEWAWKLYETDSLMRLVDEKLDKNEYREDEMKKVIEVALLCTQSTVSSRPTMSEVVVMLLSREGTSRAPTRPTFIEATNRARGDSSTSTGSSSASNATISISRFSAR